MLDLIQQLASELDKDPRHVENVVRLLDEGREFFSLKLVYDETDTLQYAALDGKEMELFDILNPDGSKTGIVRERGVAHREGSLHAASHIWVVRKKEKGGYDVLLQKRSAVKDSNAGCYDISSAGHVAAGDEYLTTAVRELKEELGLRAAPKDLKFIGIHHGGFEDVFYGMPFKDDELSAVYVYSEPVDVEGLRLQQEEVEEVIWMDYGDCRRGILDGTLNNCIYIEEFEMVGKYLGVL